MRRASAGGSTPVIFSRSMSCLTHQSGSCRSGSFSGLPAPGRLSNSPRSIARRTWRSTHSACCSMRCAAESSSSSSSASGSGTGWGPWSPRPGAAAARPCSRGSTPTDGVSAVRPNSPRPCSPHVGPAVTPSGPRYHRRASRTGALSRIARPCPGRSRCTPPRPPGGMGPCRPCRHQPAAVHDLLQRAACPPGRRARRRRSSAVPVADGDRADRHVVLGHPELRAERRRLRPAGCRRSSRRAPRPRRSAASAARPSRCRCPSRAPASAPRRGPSSPCPAAAYRSR